MVVELSMAQSMATAVSNSSRPEVQRWLRRILFRPIAG